MTKSRNSINVELLGEKPRLPHLKKHTSAATAAASQAARQGAASSFV